MAKPTNIFDLVKEAALRLRVSHWELLEEAIEALRTGKLSTVNLSEVIDPKVNPTRTYKHWLAGYRASDPHPYVNFFKRIIVRKSDFAKWRHAEEKTRKRGPEQGSTGFRVSDENLLRQMRKLLQRGSATSPYNAAWMLVAQIRGGGTQQSKVKRV